MHDETTEKPRFEMSRVTRRIAVCGLALVGLVAAVSVPAGALRADEPVTENVTEKVEKPSVDSADVYLGNASNFSKPAEVDADAVYAQISFYKEIIDNDIEPGSAKYELLMDKASKKFKCALRKVARAGSYDLVARSGSVKNATDVPDVTQEVIDQL